MEITRFKRNGLLLTIFTLTILITIPSIAQNKEAIRVNDKEVLNAVALYDKDDYQKAKASLDAIISKNDKNADAHYALGMVLLKLNKADDAEDEVEEAIKLNSNIAEYHYGLARVYMVQMNNGSMFTKMTLAGDFRDELIAALKIDPNHRLAMINLIGYYTQAPSVVGGDLNKALEIANRLLKLDEKQARISLVQIYSGLKDDKKALEEVDKLIKIDEYFGRIMMIQGLKKKGESAKVEEQYKLIETKYGNNPDYFAFFNDYGYFLLGQNRVDEAIEKLRKQVALAPKSANAHDSLGEALLKKGLLKESLAEYKKALELNPSMKSAKDKVEEIQDKLN
ncbi:MAG: hypothetical protein EHM93_12600 [Bacteroidales bacterium]|nr:MAG: hypothetical protein EHM93_12600 [Bacteroidales bacterium]